MKSLIKNLKKNSARYICKTWNIVTYIICGAVLLAGILFGGGMAVILATQGDLSFGIFFALGIIIGSFIVSFTILTFSKMLYTQLCDIGILKED